MDLSESLLPHVVGPFGESPDDFGVGHLGEASCAVGQPDQSRATIGRVGNALDVAGCLELRDQEGRGLLGDPGLQREIGDPGPGGGDPGRHASLSQGDVCVPGGHDSIERALLQSPVGDEEQDAQLRALTRVHHRAILDR